MAVASAPQPIAFGGPIAFDFRWRKRVKVQVRFYTNLEGTASYDPGLGAADVDVSTTDLVVERGGAYSAELPSDYTNATQTLAGGTWGEFEFADGSRQATAVVSAIVNPGAAVSYRVFFSIEREAP